MGRKMGEGEEKGKRIKNLENEKWCEPASSEMIESPSPGLFCPT